MSNTKDFDILIINRKNNNQYAIQVKTTLYKKKRWTLHKKNENLIGDNIFYVFVTLNELETPEYHIVPSQIVASTIRESHLNWLNTPNRLGGKHIDNPIRTFTDVEDKFLNKWDLLK